MGSNFLCGEDGAGGANSLHGTAFCEHTASQAAVDALVTLFDIAKAYGFDDWLYFDGEEEEPWDAVLDRVAAARDHFGRPPPTGESPWLEVSGLARLLAAAPVVVVDARTPDEREAAGPLPAPCVVALPAVWLVDEAGAPKLADAPAVGFLESRPAVKVLVPRKIVGRQLAAEGGLGGAAEKST